MSFNLGIKAILRLCEAQKPADWYTSKLSPQLFQAAEIPVYAWVDAHVKAHHALPQVETLSQQFPELAGIPVPEPASYYVKLVEEAFFYRVINQANIQSQEILKANKGDFLKAREVLKKADRAIVDQMYRHKIMNFGKEAPFMVLNQYHAPVGTDAMALFGWPYMDDMGGVMPGDVVSYIGRPAAGKTFANLKTCLFNWLRGRNTLFVSMEMGHLPIAQRAAAMVAGTNLTQLKGGFAKGYATPTYKKFTSTLNQIKNGELTTGQLFIVNGNLAADPEDVFALAEQLECDDVFIDGAYLLKNKNTRLDRYTRVAENCETIKRFAEDDMKTVFCSWQFNREASKKKKAGNGAQVDLDDIGYSDVIGQISSIVLAMLQEDGVETMNERQLRLLKGRNGEIGEFSIHWDFNDMNFDQVMKSDGMAKLNEDYI